MMRKIVLALALSASAPTLAAQCHIGLQNEIHLNERQLEIHQTSGDSAVVDGNNELTIHGERVPLSAEQKKAIEEYKQNLNSYVPKAKQLAQDGLALADDIIDDIADSFDTPDAFEGVKASLRAFYKDMESRYYNDGDLILPAQSFREMAQTWAEDFEKAKALFNQEFITSSFAALQAKMTAEGGINLTEMAETMAELKERIAARLDEHGTQLQKKGDALCDSLEEMVEQEQQLHQQIPELKNYPVFTI